MALKLCIPTSVPLPAPPALARRMAPKGSLDEAALPGVRQGEVVNLVNRPLNCDMVYAVACGAGVPQREGWVSSNSMRLLEPEESASVPESAHLSIKETLKHVTIMRVEEDWQDDEPSTLTLRAGDLLQVNTVKDGWAFGWSLESSYRQGWFPVAMTRKIEPTVESLVRSEAEELTPSAVMTLVDLLKATPPPPPQSWTWTGDLPAAVAESAKRGEQEWQEGFDKMEAAAQEVAEVEAAGSSPGPPEELFGEENIPEDCYPLAVCTSNFVPPKHGSGALLPLQVGELVRVTSLLESGMYHGFLEGRSTVNGWFPRRSVKIVENPLDASSDNLPVHLGTATLPPVPPNLLRRSGA